MSVKVEEKESIAQMSEGTISNEVLTEWNKRIGASLRVGNTFNQFVSLEAIRKYVNGIGDTNPLYRDVDYAKKSPYGTLIAPPNWLC